MPRIQYKSSDMVSLFINTNCRFIECDGQDWLTSYFGISAAKTVPFTMFLASAIVLTTTRPSPYICNDWRFGLVLLNSCPKSIHQADLLKVPFLIIQTHKVVRYTFIVPSPYGVPWGMTLEQVTLTSLN